MRSLNANALAKIASQYGSEPIAIIDIAWNGTDVIQYADRDVSTIKGKILEIGELDAVVNVNEAADSQSITVTLDDTDGTIKGLMNEYDLHLKDAWVYQYFEELALTDKFLLFRGKVNSPITWKEGDRTVTFTIVSQIESTEIGFSPEEGQFENLHEDLIGQPWPMCFGTTIQSKAVKLTKRYSGTTAQGVGFADPYLKIRALVNYTISGFISYAFTSDGQNQHYLRAMQLFHTYDQQKATERNWISIFNGETFPRGNITLDIGDKDIYGYFSGDVFYITGHEDFCEGKILPYADGYYGRNNYTGSGFFMPTGQIIGDNCGYVYLGPGSNVQLKALEPQKYVVSIVPGTVLKVTAWCTKNGQKFLQDIPPNYYTVTNETYGNINAVIITTKDALSKYEGMDWDEDIYVTFKSTIGPNTVDILEYLIDLYTDFNIDAVSFAHVETRLTNYPSHFTIYDRPNIINVLQEIAWQARCSIYLKNNIFYLQYLPEIQSSATTITENDILQDTLELSHTSTEDLVTKMDCEWTVSGMQDKPSHVILRNNIDKYGIHDQTYDMYIYNFVSGVLKSGSFWLIRYSNTWKKVKFQTPLHLLNIETLDYVTLNFDNIIANQPVLCKVESAKYNSDNRSIEFECWCPVRAGEMTPYPFAYPADIDSTIYYPSETDYGEYQDRRYFWDEPVDAGEWGGIPKGMSITGCKWAENDPYKDEETDDSEYSEDGKSDVDRKESSRGGIKPSDFGDISPGEPILSNTPQASAPAPGPDSPEPSTPLLKQDATEDSNPDENPQDEDGGAETEEEEDSGGEEDEWSPEDDLPDSDDISEEDWPCAVKVGVTWLNPITMVQGPSGPTSEPGIIGYPLNGTIVPAYEIYTFDSCEAACAFKQSMEDSLPMDGEVGDSTPYSAGIITGWGNGNACHAACIAGVATSVDQDCGDNEADNEYGMIGYSGADKSSWSMINE